MLPTLDFEKGEYFNDLKKAYSVITNLMSNAFKYSKVGSAADITRPLDKNQVPVTVRDGYRLNEGACSL
jgi:signal transduction histidine kinase